MEGNQHYITPSHTDGKLYEVTSGRAAAVNQAPTYDPLVTSSRRLACHSLLTNTSWTKNQTFRAKIFVTPLHFHDLCTLTFARQFDLPVVGLVTSRIGSWWSWYWLDLVPPLATNAVPPNELSANFGFFERMFNIIDFWSYISVREGDWVAPLMPSLPPGSVQPIAELYAALTTVLVAWDGLTDLQLPRASFLTSVAGLQWDRDEEITKDTLLPLQRNRNGAIFCNLKLRELWVGRAAQRALLHALAATPFTVVWRGVEEAWGEGVDDGNQTENTRKGSAMFVYKEDPPMAALLAHPRHRLLISMCGESDVTAAVLVGSPTLCIPVTPDQHLTSNKLRDLGLAVVVPARDVTTNQMRDVIRELTTNRSYRSRGRQLAEEYIDQPLHVSDRVLHTLEKLMRRPWR
ncbi:UDP-glucuronosyltransferase 2B15 [Chionoecetes opilio]|uniref:UDP-glucuronosyltransferase 2B15 n=1 Tax=Chionoecetes opilio TaxID=41210 RepID=A0A8J5CJU5_CHIOP|nr:UDP-glucuronosyltransferase 2B15 [Chionoecetes opilio]